MLKVENIKTMGWEGALRGMRNAKNSWHLADTEILPVHDIDEDKIEEVVSIGPNDMQLSTTLAQCGTPDRKFLRMIHIQMDITAPLYWWKEYDTYKVATVANSCSTMHKIHVKEFTFDDFSTEHLLNLSALSNSKGALDYTIQLLNFWRDRYNQNIDDRREYFETNGYERTPSKKECWWQMIQLLPSSYNQKRTVDINYETALQIWHWRHAHKLDEWHTLCHAIEELPYMKKFIEASEGKEIWTD